MSRFDVKFLRAAVENGNEEQLSALRDDAGRPEKKKRKKKAKKWVAKDGN